MLTGDLPFRRAYLRVMIDNVEVGDTKIRIHGSKTVLAHLMMGTELEVFRNSLFWEAGTPKRMKLGTRILLYMLYNFYACR